MLPCNSSMSSLLQLLGLLNSTSVALSGLGKQVKSCSVSAGSDACWQLNSYRPNKKEGGGFFLCQCLGSENYMWIWADRCVKFWVVVQTGSFGEEEDAQPDLMPHSRRERLPGCWAPTSQGQPQSPHGCLGSPSRAQDPMGICPQGIGGAWIWPPSGIRPHMRDVGGTERPQLTAWAPAVTAVLGGCWSCRFGSLVCQVLGKDLHHCVALCQSGNRDCSSRAVVWIILHSRSPASTSALLADAPSCSPQSCGQ